IPVVTPSPKMSDQAFAGLLGRTIAELRNKATASGVALPQQYDFTFAAQRRALNFPAGSIDNWIPQLNDIVAISDALFQARVNALDGIKRVPVSSQDVGEADFLTANIVSNQFAVFTPYEVSFRGFTPELAAVLEQMQRTTNFVVIKSVSVAPAPISAAAGDGMQVAPVRMQQDPRRRVPQPGVQQRRGVQAGAVAETVIAEQPLQVTLQLDVVKLNPVQ
ncbi:MAG: hypothetical protein ACK4UN_09670, partial [Limisphaerales bacterium]